MIPIFQVKKQLGHWQMDDDAAKLYIEHKLDLPDGDYELVLRPKQAWNTDKMRKYFHGPVLEFIALEVKRAGIVITKGQLKEDFKEMFGKKKWVKTLKGEKEVPVSMSGYDLDDYKSLLNSISDWCKDKLKCDIPDSDEVE